MIIQEHVLPMRTTTILCDYALMDEARNYNPDVQVSNAHFMSRHIIGDIFLNQLTEKTSDRFGLSLCPTYSCGRVYRRGHTMRRHTDRDACEYSISVTVGTNAETPWPLFFDPGTPVNLKIGEGVYYKGREVPHWRDPCPFKRGEYLVQWFFHFIDTSGSLYPEHILDRRHESFFPKEWGEF